MANEHAEDDRPGQVERGDATIDTPGSLMDTAAYEPSPPTDVRPVNDTAAAPSCPAPVGKRVANRARDRAAVPVLDTGERVDDFEIANVLGRGAFGVVYRARQISLDREVALKIAANKGSEGRTMARLEHRYIVQVFSESVSDDGTQRRLCMQLVPGTSLQKVIAELRRSSSNGYKWVGADILAIVDRTANFPAVLDPSALHEREALAQMDAVQATAWIGGRLAEALDYAHRQGVLHRDIKPANILMNQYGQPMLADFNISQRGTGEAAEGQFGGTLGYMSPEHLDAFNPTADVTEDAVTERADIYSLGMVLHELLLGRSPFPSKKVSGGVLERVKQITKIRRETKPSLDPGPADAHKVLKSTICRCLEPDSSSRYVSSAELAETLDGCRRLRQAEHDLPAPHAITRVALARPFLWLILFSLLPHVAGSIVNISYNFEQIIRDLTAEQWQLFNRLVAGYNLIVYPLALSLAWSVLRPVWRTWRDLCGTQPVESWRVDDARRRAIQLPIWAAGLAALGWLPGSILFPLILDACYGLQERWPVYLHFLVSFTFSGLIAMAYSYCGVHYVALRVLYPRMWNNPANFEKRAREELNWMPIQHALIPFLVGSIPILGVFFLTHAFRGEDVGWVYEETVRGLLIMGMLGNYVAWSATRRMSQTLVALTGKEV